MDTLYVLIVAALSVPWYRDARDAWRLRRTVRRETRMLDQELDFLV